MAASKLRYETVETLWNPEVVYKRDALSERELNECFFWEVFQKTRTFFYDFGKDNIIVSYNDARYAVPASDFVHRCLGKVEWTPLDVMYILCWITSAVHVVNYKKYITEEYHLELWDKAKKRMMKKWLGE